VVSGGIKWFRLFQVRAHKQLAAPCNAGAIHARRRHITEGLLQGKTDTDIAREEGIDRQMAGRVANSPEVMSDLDALIATHPRFGLD
jgi:hypothetical protein